MIWFDRRKAQGLSVTLELRVRLPRIRRTVPFALRIERSRLRLRPGAPRDPAVTATLALRDLIRLGIGSARWPELLSSGRLELSGDPFLAIRFPSLFRLRA